MNSFKGSLLFGVLFLGSLLNKTLLFGAFQDPYWSSRVAALSGAYTAIADDATGIFYNPAAGLGKMTQKETNFTYGKLLAGLDGVHLSLYQFSYIQPMGQSMLFGIGWGNFTAMSLYREDTILLSFARRFSNFIPTSNAEFSLGVSMKYLSRGFVLNESSSQDPIFKAKQHVGNVSFDLHAYSVPSPLLFPGLSLGLTVRSLNQPSLGFSGGEKLPLEIVGGVAYKWGNFLFPMDISQRNGKLDIRFGSELKFFQNQAAVRLGLDQKRFGTGFGYTFSHYKNFSVVFDYAFLLALKMDESVGSHRTSLGIKF